MPTLDWIGKEAVVTGESTSPIVLLQAQTRSRTNPHRLTFEVVYDALPEAGVPEEQVARHKGGFS